MVTVRPANNAVLPKDTEWAESGSHDKQLIETVVAFNIKPP